MSTPAEPLTTVAGDNDLVFTAAYQHLPRSDTRRDKCLTSLIQALLQTITDAARAWSFVSSTKSSILCGSLDNCLCMSNASQGTS